MIKAVLFDCDGTIFDTSYLIFAGYKTLFDKYLPNYKPSKEEYNSFIGPALKDMIPKYFDGDLSILIEEYRAGGRPYFDKEHIGLFPGFLILLRELKQRNIKVGIVTSREYPSTMRLLNVFSLETSFDSISCLDHVKHGKPNKEIFMHALKQLNVLPSETLMIGDHYNDIKGAVNSSICPVAVNWSVTSKDELKSYGAKYFIDNFLDILKILEDFK